MHNHTLGWTSDSGPNVFALGWLSVVTVFIAGGGMDEFPATADGRRRREELEFVALLVALVEAIERDR